MSQSDMPPPAPERVANPRIRKDQAAHCFQQISETMHCATPKTPTRKHCSTVAEVSAHNHEEKQTQTVILIA